MSRGRENFVFKIICDRFPVAAQIKGYNGAYMAEKVPKKRIRDTALTVTRWVGSPQSILVHTCIFITSFLAAYIHLITFDRMLLVLTTLVSLEAIYLSIFIQISINSANEAIGEVEMDVAEIQEDVEKIEKDVDEIQEDVEEISEDVDEIQEDVEGIEKDVDEIQEDVEEMSEEDEVSEKLEKTESATLEEIQKNLKKLMKDIESLQHKA